MSRRGGTSTLGIWGYPLAVGLLSDDERRYLSRLPPDLPGLDWVSDEVNRTWRALGLDNRRPVADQPAVAAFYQHPVWLMVGIYSECDPVSRGHRQAMATYLASVGARRVADFGGGFGALARQVLATSASAEVSIVEPFASTARFWPDEAAPRVRYVTDLEAGAYDAVVAQDVLDFVDDPVGLAGRLAEATRPSGLLLITTSFLADCDYLLRRSLHLRHTLSRIMRAMGLEPAGRVPGASHVLVLRRTAARLDLPAARRAERLSRWLGPWLNRCERPWGWVSRASRRAVGLPRPTRPVRGRQTPDK